MSLAKAFALADAMTAAVQVKAAASGDAPYRANAYDQQTPSLANVREQYRANHDVVFSCVRAIASRAAGQPIRVAKSPKRPGGRALGDLQAKQRAGEGAGRGGPWLKEAVGLEILDTHELLDAIDDPNPLMVRWSLLYQLVASLELTGKAYWWLRQDSDRIAVWPLPSHWVEPIHQPGRWNAAWNVMPGGRRDNEQTVPGDEVAYFYYPDPENPLGSLSTVERIARSISADADIQTSQAWFFKNSIKPGMAIVTGDVGGKDADGRSLGPPILERWQKDQLIQPILAYYRGVLRHGEPIVLDGLVKDIRKLSAGIDEMDYPNSGRITKERILRGFGVNAIALGEVENANKASATVADASFCSMLNPKLELLSQCMTAWGGPRFDDDSIVVWIEPCRPKDDEALRAMYNDAIKAKACSVNEYRREVLGLPPIKGGDVAYGSMTETSVAIELET